MDGQEVAQNFNGWAILEIFGHQRYAGYVSTQAFGTAVMIRLDVPELKERKRITKRPGWIDEGDRGESRYAPAGTVVRESPVQGYTKLFGVAAVYSLTPCDEAAALAAVEELQSRKMMVVKLPEGGADVTRQLTDGDDGASFVQAEDPDEGDETNEEN